MICFSTKINEENNYNFMKFNTRIVTTLLRWLPIIMFLGFMIFSLIRAESVLEKIAYFFTFTVLSIVFAIYVPKFYLSILKIQSKKIIKLNGENVVNQYSFSDEGFSVISENGSKMQSQLKIKYSDILKIRNYKHYIFIYLNNNQAFIIDRNEIRNFADNDNLIAILVTNCMYKIK